MYVVALITLPLRAGLQAIQYTQAIFWAYLSITLFSLLFAYPLIEYFDLPGVVIGMLLVYVILITAFLLSLRKRLS